MMSLGTILLLRMIDLQSFGNCPFGVVGEEDYLFIYLFFIQFWNVAILRIIHKE
jgi:hypothetical protein